MEEKWCDLSHLTIENNSKTCYILIRETTLYRLTGDCTANIGVVVPGMLVEEIGVENGSALRVRVLDRENKIWHETEWKCPKIDLLKVSSLICSLLRAVSSLEDRVRLAKNKQFCKDVEEIKPNTRVWYCPDSDNLVTCLAKVKLVGPVPELGDGHYFGLDLLENQEICKPSPLISKYFKAFCSQGTFATLSNINTRKTEALDAIKNYEKNFLLNDISQPNKAENLFSIKSNQIINSRKSIDIPAEKQYSILADADNNNEAMRITDPKSKEIRKKNCLDQEKDDNKKLYESLKKNFDPLNAEHKWSTDIDSGTEPEANQRSSYYNLIGYNEEENESYRKCQQPSSNNDLNVGSCVKVLVDNDAHYGVIRWIGATGGSNPKKLMAAIELDHVHPLATDGTYKDIRYFECSPHKAFFTDLKDCHPYDMAASSSYYEQNARDFGNIQSPVIKGRVPPILVNGDLDKICGKYRGIQGHHNSCYLDATLFSMFAFTGVFDSLLFRPVNDSDCREYEEVQRVLREEIVNPLRRDLLVGADHVMKLRTLLEKSSSVSGLTCEEKDPEEFLTSLVAQTLRAEPFLKLNSGQDAYHYQLFVEKDDKLIVPTVQQLLEQSFLSSNIRLMEVPRCLIIQMPRFGKSYKMYSKIQPTLLLDVTDIIEDSPRQCTVCGKLAELECKECYEQCGVGLESINFCKGCIKKVHSHEKRNNHQPKTITVPFEFEILKEQFIVPRLYMELLAVVCIETSHYVAFVKCAPGPDAPWCFFDSMADRKGEQDGYNIPEMVPCPDFPYWLSEEGASDLSTLTDDRLLPEHAKRLLCDGYMCMYQSTDVMYK